jgi:hypothetical protein
MGWIMGTLFKILVIFWAAPTSLVGFLVLAMVCRGARIRWVDGALEVWGPAICGMFQRFSPIKAEAMVLGHFVFGTSSEMLAAVRRHERIHVRQVECWGPLFLPAYLIASAVVWMRGLNFYRDNPFGQKRKKEVFSPPHWLLGLPSCPLLLAWEFGGSASGGILFLWSMQGI